MTKTLRNKRFSKRTGASLIEVVTASGISTFIMFSLIMMVLTGMKTWIKGQAEIDADLSSQMGIRTMSQALRESMYVKIDGDGKGIDFRVPATDGGAYAIPTVWDNINRRIYLDTATGQVMLKVGDDVRVIARDVVATDPTNNNATYQLFSTTDTGTVRRVSIMLVSQNSNDVEHKSYSRIRESVYLRNVPILTQ